MVTNLKNILFAGLNWPCPDKLEWLKTIETIDNSYWFKDNYRNCDLLPLLTQLGHYKCGQTGNKGKTEQMQWTPFVPLNIKNFLNKFVLTWLSPKPRIYLIRVFPDQSMNEHIDCNREAFGSLQLKIRLNIIGSTSELYFMKKTEKLYIPNYEGFFIIDGSWPHGLKNKSKNIRYTLALGSPWSGQNFYHNNLQQIIYKTIDLPYNYESFFEN